MQGIKPMDLSDYLADYKKTKLHKHEISTILLRWNTHFSKDTMDLSAPCADSFINSLKIIKSYTTKQRWIFFENIEIDHKIFVRY